MPPLRPLAAASEPVVVRPAGRRSRTQDDAVAVLSRLRELAKTDLTQTTYRLLRARIVEGELVPGERLRLDVLARQLSISRTPIRDALNQLAAEGLIEIRRRRGTFVARVDKRTLDELYQLRFMIDTFAGETLAGRITSRQARQLALLVRRMEAQVQGDAYLDYAAFLESDRAFHLAIVRLLDNRRLTALYEEIILPLWLVRAQQGAGLAQDRDAPASLETHRAILRALQSNSPRLVSEAIVAHLKFGRARLDSRLSAEDGAGEL